jgi:hypothetical protein
MGIIAKALGFTFSVVSLSSDGIVVLPPRRHSSPSASISPLQMIAGKFLRPQISQVGMTPVSSSASGGWPGGWRAPS